MKTLVFRKVRNLQVLDTENTRLSIFKHTEEWHRCVSSWSRLERFQTPITPWVIPTRVAYFLDSDCKAKNLASNNTIWSHPFALSFLSWSTWCIWPNITLLVNRIFLHGCFRCAWVCYTPKKRACGGANFSHYHQLFRVYPDDGMLVPPFTMIIVHWSSIMF